MYDVGRQGLRLVLLAVAAALCTNAAALGQIGAGSDAFDLLGYAGVRKEVEVEPYQERDIAAVRVEMEREFEQARRKLAAKYEGKLEQVLLPHQSRRLREIALQMRGAAALADDDMAEILKLSDKQRREIVDQRRTARLAAEKLRMPGIDVRERFAAVRRIHEKEEAGMLSILTAEQRRQFEEMRGRPFQKGPLAIFGDSPQRGKQ
jgi:hypothetical protein